MSTNEHFKDSFWSPSTTKDDIPKYAQGLRALFQRLEHSVVENKAITRFLQTRVNNELACARSLLIETTDLDMNPELKNAFGTVCQESVEAARYHRIRASVLIQDVLQPLLEFTRIFQDKIQARKNRMEDEISAFEHSAQTALMTRAVYWTKCRALDLACPDYRPALPEGFEEDDDISDDFVGEGARRRRSSSVTSELNVDEGGVRLGKCTVLPHREVARSMNRMQTMVEGIKSSTNTRKFLGRDLFEWVRDYMVTVQHDVTLDTESQEICQQLVALKLLKSIPKETPGFYLDQYYHIQQNVVERYLRKTRIRRTAVQNPTQEQETDAAQNTTLEVPSSDSTSPVGVLNSFFGKLSSKMDTILAAQKEMNEADIAYKKKIKFVNSQRRMLEESVIAYFDEMEQLEKNRIQTIKQSFTTMATALSESLPMFKETYSRISLFQEALKPEHDIHSIIEQYQTGHFCPKPMIYENYYYGSATDQIFGVPLEEVTQVYGVYVPPIVLNGIRLIDKGFEVRDSKDIEKTFDVVWSTLLPLKKMNSYCAQLDCLSGTQLKSKLETFSMNALANLIRVYLSELPECLLTFNMYGPIKMLYAKQQSNMDRLSSVSDLISTLPPSNYHTLKALSFHLFKLLKQTQTSTADDMLNKLISIFSFILMRPRTSNASNIHDRHPKKLVRDLFTQYHIIFTKKTRKTSDDTSYFLTQRPKLYSRESMPTIKHIRTLSLPRDFDFGQDECYSPGGSLVLPSKMRFIFGDPDHSNPTTPTRESFDKPVDPGDHVDTARLSSDVSFILSTDDEEEEREEKNELSKPKIVIGNRSRATTNSSMDNVVLDSFFDM